MTKTLWSLILLFLEFKVVDCRVNSRINYKKSNGDLVVIEVLYIFSTGTSAEIGRFYTSMLQIGFRYFFK